MWINVSVDGWTVCYMIFGAQIHSEFGFVWKYTLVEMDLEEKLDYGSGMDSTIVCKLSLNPDFTPNCIWVD